MSSCHCTPFLLNHSSSISTGSGIDGPLVGWVPWMMTSKVPSGSSISLQGFWSRDWRVQSLVTARVVRGLPRSKSNKNTIVLLEQEHIAYTTVTRTRRPRSPHARPTHPHTPPHISQVRRPFPTIRIIESRPPRAPTPSEPRPRTPLGPAPSPLWPLALLLPLPLPVVHSPGSFPRLALPIHHVSPQPAKSRSSPEARSPSTGCLLGRCA